MSTALPYSIPGKVLAMALCGLLCLPLLAGCSGDPPTVTPPIPTSDPGARATAPAGAESWSVEPLNTKLGIGFERVAFRLNDAAGQPVRAGTIELVFYLVTSDGATQRVATGEALYFGPTLPGGGSWVAYTEFDSSGPWVMDINGRTEDGRSGTAESQFLVSGRDGMPTYGFPPPEIETPSLADGLSLEQLSSDRSPLEMLYLQSVGEAVGQGKPALIHFGSPAHCEGDGCRAALTEIRAIATRYGERLNTVHVESRDLENPSELSEAAEAWDLPSEPWTFLFDGSGFLAVRVEGAIGNTELGLLIDRVLSGQ